MKRDPWGEFKDAPGDDPWGEFGDATPAPRPSALPKLAPSGAVIDGDTYRTQTGPNVRLFGADAFELRQQGQTLGGDPVPLGQRARSAFGYFARPGANVQATGAQTWGRPVASLTFGGADAGESLIRQGLAVPVPRYLQPNEPEGLTNDLPPSVRRYVTAQRDAIASEAGAYGGRFQIPEDFRKSGADAPWQGKVMMTPDQAAAWGQLVRDPTTTPEQADAWLASQGQSAENVRNTVRFLSRNPQAEANPAFQQRDAEGNPVQPEPRGFFLRSMDALNEGIADIAAAPFDLSHAIATPIGNLLGVDMSAGSPYSAGIRDAWHGLGLGQRDEGSAPRSDFERYGQAFLRGTGSALIPVGGTLGAGSKLATRTPSLATQASAVRSAFRDSLVDAARSPGTAVALEAGAGAGSYLGEEVANDVAPGNPYAALAGQMIGGLGGGFAGGAAARRMGARSSGDTVVPARVPDAPEAAAMFDDGAPMVERDGALFAKLADGREVPIPVAPSGKPGVTWTENGWEALLEVGPDGSGQYGPQNIPGALPSPYRDLANRLNAATPRPMGAPDTAQPMPGNAGNAPEALPPAQAMEGGPGRSELVGPDPWAEFGNAAPEPAAPRQRDYIDLTQPRRMLADAPDMERLAAANRIRPGDVLPVPSNTIDGVDEALRIDRGRYQREAAGNPRAALETRGYRDPENGLKVIRRKGPPDLVTWLRSEGGLALSDQDIGDFRHLGIDNAPRNDLEFAKGEDKLGNLLDDERGMPLDYAAMRAWEAGYFPDLPERPTVQEFMDALVSTHRGGSGRVFHPDDLPELDRYRAADAQYQGVKAAQQDGVTLMRDRSEPVSLDDLDANAAPVTAYEEWGENAPDFAGNIRLDGLDSPQSIKRALDTTDKRVGGFDAARRGRVAQAETERLASELGMTPDDLLKRRKGQAFNAEEALAARQILAKSANELVNMARRISRADGDPSTVDAARFREAWLRHVAIQEQVAGMTAEAGRALQQFRQIADARAVRGTVLPEMIERAGGARGIKDAADMIVDHADDPAKLNQLTEQALKPGLKDKLLELWYNSLLSGPQTHAVNILSNTITSLLQIPEHAAAAFIGAPRRLLGTEADSVIFSEVGARTVGLLAGTREGLREAARTFRTGEPSDLMSKVETQEQNAIPGRLGKVLRTPTRALAAEDDLFKAMARRMELHGLAIRKASAEGLKGQAARARAAELIANPTDEMLSQAFDYGRYLTFQRPLSSGHGVSLAAQMLTSRAPILKLVLPFVRTPANLLKFALERSPAAPIVKEWRKDFTAGGSRRDLAAARMMVGTGVVALITQMAAEGLITGGGPADEGARAMLEADGWQPYSFRIGDQYYSYQRLDPLASTFGIAADLVDLQSHMTEGQREKSAQLLVAATLKNLSNKTWLSGVSDAVEAINDPERRAENYMARLAGSVTVPAGVAQVARVVDPVLREAREPMDRIRSRIPGVSSSLPARRDVLGNEMVSEGGLGPDIMSPIWTRARRNDPVVNALLDSDISITKPQRKVRDPISGRMIELTPFQFDDYQALTGDLARPRLSALVQGREWSVLNPGEQEKAVDKVMRGARSEARGLLLSALRDPAEGNDPWADFQDAGKAKADPWREFADAP